MAEKIKIHLSIDPSRGFVEIDGERIEGVVSVTSYYSVGNIPTVTLELYTANLIIEGEGEIETITAIRTEATSFSEINSLRINEEPEKSKVIPKKSKIKEGVRI